MQMVVDHCRQQVVRSSNCVEVAREVQVKQFHWNYLAVATTSSAALNTKRWSH